MALLQALTQLFEEEMEKKMNEKLTKYVEYISKTYDISLKLLLNDLKNVDALSAEAEKTQSQQKPAKPGHCNGICVNGKICTKKGRAPTGFCKMHANQVREKPAAMQIMVKSTEHNHPFPPLFSKNCPACAKKNKSMENLLIDI